MFFSGFGSENDARICGGMCENIVNTSGFRDVSLFHVFSELVDIQSTFGCLFGRFLGTLGSLFVIWEGVGSRYENR